MITTAATIVNRAMKLLGILGESEVPTPEEMQDALRTLNSMVDSWSLEKLFIYEDVQRQAELDVDEPIVTIGPTGDIEALRPIKISNVLLSKDNRDIRLSILQRTQFQQISYKLTPGLPSYVLYEPTIPDGTIYMHPVINQEGYTLKFDAQQLLFEFEQTTSVNLPPGYDKALSYGLAIEIAPEYNVPVTITLAQNLQAAKNRIKTVNAETPILDIGAYHGYVFDIKTGGF